MGRSRAATTASSSIRACISTASIPNISSAPLTRRSRTHTQSRRCAASCSFMRQTLAGGCPAVSRPPSSRTKIEALTHLPRLREKVRRSEDDAKAAAIGLMARRSPSAWLRAAFPIVAQLESYRSEWLLKDITAGLAIAAVALPIGVAYPAIAGLPPVVGLYASIRPLVGYAIFGSSRQLIVGPDAATLTILAASLSQVPMGGVRAAKGGCLGRRRDCRRPHVPVVGRLPARLHRELFVA